MIYMMIPHLLLHSVFLLPVKAHVGVPKSTKASGYLCTKYKIHARKYLCRWIQGRVVSPSAPACLAALNLPMATAGIKKYLGT